MQRAQSSINSLRAISARNLATDFGLETGPLHVLASALRNSLVAAWRRGIGLTKPQTNVGYRDDAQPANVNGIEGNVIPDNAFELLALHTSYALLVKLIAAKVLLDHNATLPVPLPVEGASGKLHAWLCRLESGDWTTGRGLKNLILGHHFGWYTMREFWSQEIQTAIEPIFELVNTYDARFKSGPSSASEDLFQSLYQTLLSPTMRHALGEYYTPKWLVQAVLEDVPKASGWRGLDPCCGSGAFIVEMLAQALGETAGLAPEHRLPRILERVKGLDINPLAVQTARVNYFVAIAGAWDGRQALEIPICLADAVTGCATELRQESDQSPLPNVILDEHFDFVVGNPPWVSWTEVPTSYREAIASACVQRDLIPTAGYTGGKDLNLSALIAHVSLERWVKPGGHLAFLMPRQLLHLRSAANFRRWILPNGERFRLARLTDWSAINPFDAACQPMTFLMERSEQQEGPIQVSSYASRGRTGPRPPDVDWETVKGRLFRRDSAGIRVGSEYLVGAAVDLPRLARMLGNTVYRGRRATETSPHAIYWVRLVQPATGKRQAPRHVWVENDVNPRSRARIAVERFKLDIDYLFPLLRGSQIRRFGVERDDCWVIFPHHQTTGARPVTPEKMPALTLNYLLRHRETLLARSSYKEYRRGQAFYGLWRVGAYSFAPYKVVWPEIGGMRAAVISDIQTPWGESKMLVPEGKVNLIPFETDVEAHYVCALLNTPDVASVYAAISSQIGRPAQLPLAIPPFDSSLFTHRALAAISRAAHSGATRPDRYDPILNWLAGRLQWGSGTTNVDDGGIG